MSKSGDLVDRQDAAVNREQIFKQFSVPSSFTLDEEPFLRLVIVRSESGYYRAEPALCYLSTEEEPVVDWGSIDMPPGPEFKSAQAAELHERLLAEWNGAEVDLRTFHAPQECGRLAHAHWKRAHREDFEYLKAECVNMEECYSPLFVYLQEA